MDIRLKQTKQGKTNPRGQIQLTLNKWLRDLALDAEANNRTMKQQAEWLIIEALKARKTEK